MRPAVRHRAGEEILPHELPDRLDARVQGGIGEARVRNLNDQTAALPGRGEAELEVVVIVVDLAFGPLQEPDCRDDLALLVGETGMGGDPLVLKVADLIVRDYQVR